jgi:hypothetical protein
MRSLIATSSALVLTVFATLSCGGGTPEAAAPETPVAESPGGEPEPARAEPASAPMGATEAERTVYRLDAEFDQVAENGTTTDEARAFIKKHERELTSLYVDAYDDLSPKSRVDLINLLVSFQTEATAPALAAAISRYAEGTASVDEAIWACQAAKKMKSATLAPALMKAFDAIDMGQSDGQRFGRHLGDAMDTNVVPGWKPALEKHRDAVIQPPESYEDTAQVRAFRNRKFWKETSSRLLARLESDSAP